MNSKLHRALWGKQKPILAHKVSLFALLAVTVVHLALPLMGAAFNFAPLLLGAVSLSLVTWFFERKSAQRQLQKQKADAERGESS